MLTQSPYANMGDSRQVILNMLIKCWCQKMYVCGCVWGGGGGGVGGGVVASPTYQGN